MNELNPLDWFRFVSYVRSTNRFVLNKPLKLFVEQVLNSAESRRKVLHTGSEYFRARTHEEIFFSAEFKAFHADLMGAPLPQVTKEGRINPRGIPYLYLSDLPKVALAEVRPSKNQIIQIASFKLQRTLQVVDVRSVREVSKVLSIALAGALKGSPQSLEQKTWEFIDSAFSLPTLPGDPHQIYAPTQCLAGAFKEKGFDGIFYGSSLSDDGCNLVLFDVNAAKTCEQDAGKLLQIEKISYKTSTADLGLELLNRLLEIAK